MNTALNRRLQALEVARKPPAERVPADFWRVLLTDDPVGKDYRSRFSLAPDWSALIRTADTLEAQKP